MSCQGTLKIQSNPIQFSSVLFILSQITTIQANSSSIHCNHDPIHTEPVFKKSLAKETNKFEFKQKTQSLTVNPIKGQI